MHGIRPPPPPPCSRPWSFRVGWTDTWDVLAGAAAVTVAGELLRNLHPAPKPPELRPAPPELPGTGT